jgi:hypothetical protein
VSQEAVFLFFFFCFCFFFPAFRLDQKSFTITIDADAILLTSCTLLSAFKERLSIQHLLQQ